MRVLIAYGTRYGSTEEIAKEIAKTIEEKGLETELINLGVIKSKDWPPLDGFDGIIVGTSLKVNSWKKQVKTFLEKHKNELKNTKFGMFTCGVWAIAEPLEAFNEVVFRLAKNFGLKADIHDAFGGVIDLSEDSNVGRAGRAALKLTALGFEKEQDIPIDKKARNDFRDWDKIRRFAEGFADLLQ
ncbi:MAG: flavodoxin domain-containing protein [Candidatus Hermodarchaeota archaeon]